MSRRDAANGKAKKPFTIVGSIKFEEAIIRTLRNREGTTMDSKEILEAALGMRAKTNAKDPLGILEWILYDVMKKRKALIERVAPHKYVYLKQEAQAV